MKHTVHQISDRAMDIIRRGGKCTDEEMDYLSMSTPCEEFPYENGYYIQCFLLIYLPEVRGYCTIYYEATPFPAHPLSWAYYGSNDPPLHNHINKEIIHARIHELQGEEPNRMKFHDLTYLKEFDSYDELKDYSRSVEPNKFFFDPRNDPEFKAVYDQGYYLSEDEGWALLRYRNYCVFSDKTRKAYAVINLGEQEKIYVEISFWRKVDSPFKPYYVTLPATQGTFYVERDGKIFEPYQDGCVKMIEL